MTIEEAKKDLRKNFERGTSCPCCGQFVKLYKRKLNSGMASTLIRIYKHAKYEWIHVKDMLRMNKYKNSHDWTLLKEWGFIESNDAAGEWKITNKGVEFIKGTSTAPSHVHIYNKTTVGFSSTQTDIKESLGNHFNYEELMSYED